ncbi:MAG: sigma-70 family RNA polymerase sigma factor [Flavobacteriaceae bacterium]|nr:sigma-70 family RNA polymerase sigma factor [Flavobacteriaceae bacterium]
MAYKLAEEEEKDYGIGSDETNEKVKVIINAVQSLKENYRVALNLSLFEGYDNEEIAEILGISDENCRTTISRAKSKLRSILSSHSLAH